MKSTDEIMELWMGLFNEDTLEVGEIESLAIAAGAKCTELGLEIEMMSTLGNTMTREVYTRYFNMSGEVTRLKEVIEWAERILVNNSKKNKKLDDPLANRIKEAAKLVNEYAFKAKASKSLANKFLDNVRLIDPIPEQT